MGYAGALASIAAVSSAAAFYILQMVTTQYSARLARRVARGWVGLGPIALVVLFLATILWSNALAQRVLVVAGLVTVVFHLWWVATSALSDQKLLRVAVPRDARHQMLTREATAPKRPPIEAPTIEFTELISALELQTPPKPRSVTPQPWPGGPTSYADPLLMFTELLVGAIRQSNTALIDLAFETLLTLMREVIHARGRVDTYMASIFSRAISVSPDEGFINNRINVWLAHAIVLVLPAGYPRDLLQLMTQQWSRLWVRRDLEHLDEGWSIIIDGMTQSSNTTWNLLNEWIGWANDWTTTYPWPDIHDDLYTAWSEAFKQLCSLSLVSSDALQNACEVAPHVIEDVAQNPSMDILPLALIVDLVETLVNAYRLRQLRNDNCMHIINGLMNVRIDELPTEWLATKLKMDLLDSAFQIFALQASLPVDSYRLRHSAGDMARRLWRGGTHKRSLARRGTAAMRTALWQLPWGVFRRGIQAWVWYLARNQRVRPTLSSYGTWRVGRRATRQPQFIRILSRESEEYQEHQTRQLNEMTESLMAVH